jgi:hypothetical protein
MANLQKLEQKIGEALGLEKAAQVAVEGTTVAALLKDQDYVALRIDKMNILNASYFISYSIIHGRTLYTTTAIAVETYVHYLAS